MNEENVGIHKYFLKSLIQEKFNYMLLGGQVYLKDKLKRFKFGENFCIKKKISSENQ